MSRRIVLSCLAALLAWMWSFDLSAVAAPADTAEAPATRKAESQATPKDLVEKLAAGFQAASKDKVVSCLDQSTDNGKKAAEAFGCIMDIVAAGKDLHGAVVVKFGKEAAEKAGMNSFDSGPFGDAEELAKAQYQEEGDKATVTIEATPSPLKLVKKDGKWFLDADELMKEEDLKDIDKVKKMSAAMSGAFKECKTALTDCKTAEEFKEKSGAIMMKAMMGGMGE